MHDGLYIPARLERLPLSRFSWVVLSVGALAFLVEAMDTSVIAAVLKPMRAALKISPGEMGFLSVSAIITTVIGIILVGPLADTYGRKRMLVAGILIAEIFTIAMYFATSFKMFLLFRLLTGLGLGFIFPVTLTYVAEFVGSEQRGYFTGLCNGVLGLGYFVSLLASYYIVPKYGYHVTFLAPGLLIIAVPYIMIAVPESPRWLVSTGNIEKAERIVKGIEDNVAKQTGRELPPIPLTTLDNPPSGGAFTEIFKNSRLKTTLALWLMLSVTFIVFYTRLLYMPLVLTQTGIGDRDALLYSAIMNAVAVPGNIAGGILMNLVGRRWAVAIYGGLTGIFAIGFGLASAPLALVVLGCGIFWFDTFAAQKMLINESYPTAIRGTGAASAEFVARTIGGIIWAWSVPGLLAIWGAHVLFVAIGAMALILIPLSVLTVRETRDVVV